MHCTVTLGRARQGVVSTETFHLFVTLPVIVALFSGSPRVRFFVLQATENWAGPGNKATVIVRPSLTSNMTYYHGTQSVQHTCKLCLVLMMKGSKAGLGRLQKENNHDASIRGSQEMW